MFDYIFPAVSTRCTKCYGQMNIGTDIGLQNYWHSVSLSRACIAVKLV